MLVPGADQDAATYVPQSGPAAVSGPPTSHRQPSRGGQRGALTVVAWALTAIVGGSLGIAVLMSILDDHVRGSRSEAAMVAVVVVVVAVVLVSRMVRAATTPRRTRRKPD